MHRLFFAVTAASMQSTVGIQRDVFSQTAGSKKASSPRTVASSGFGKQGLLNGFSNFLKTLFSLICRSLFLNSHTRVADFSYCSSDPRLGTAYEALLRFQRFGVSPVHQWAFTSRTHSIRSDKLMRIPGGGVRLSVALFSCPPIPPGGRGRLIYSR